MRYLLALGANLSGPAGAPDATLDAALDRIAELGTGLRASRYHSSPAWPAGSGPDYVNAAASITSQMGAEALLAALHAIEADLGRVRGRRWAARASDLDLLGGDDLVSPDAETVRAAIDAGPSETPPATLLLPHPRLHERAFVLVPLMEVAPDWRHPLLDLTVRQMHGALPEAAKAEIVPILR
ncbi:2-amino-4-hydroxy-6-hydroxymethyldihydropteridine diphosphokinase [Roseobacter sp. HKCCA0434]|uniref:2-amino-4-hydroxy-6- hydroxymethyldihydropteridine diphosphokinase n=1 Tax=Roseobacter sp. HKCCA0434 TaxID=3079297 RepID=UPI002905849A|nr:2-amino-4-hydroxy-6-hydroxymethyldihydropteridine diphosphokinase [Roseobacter sp. HKCCA0434]